jgi:hypothetical protein
MTFTNGEYEMLVMVEEMTPFLVDGTRFEAKARRVIRRRPGAGIETIRDATPIVWGVTRKEAIDRLREAFREWCAKRTP